MPNSKHYLLGFWAALVSPVILLQDKAPKALESFIQQAGTGLKRRRRKAADGWEQGNHEETIIKP